MWPVLAQHEAGSGGFQHTIDVLARTPLSKIVIFVAICSIVRILLYGYLKNTVPHRRHGIYQYAKFLNEAMDAIVYAGVFVFMLIRPFAIQAFLIPSGSMLQTLYVNDFIVANKAIYRYTEPQHGDIMVFKPPVWALNPADGQVDGETDFIKRCMGLPGDVVQVVDGKLVRNGKGLEETYLTDSPGEGAEGNGHAIATGKDVPMDVDWKLVHYTGKARPLLDGQYIPVQINRNAGAGEPKCNFGMNGVCKNFAVGCLDTADSGYSWVLHWKTVSELSTNDTDYAKELEDAKPAAVPKGYVLMMGDNRNHSYDGRAWGLVPREDVIGRSEFIWLPISRWRVTR